MPGGMYHARKNVILRLMIHSSVASIAANNAPIAQYAQPGGFNDFDMMASPSIPAQPQSLTEVQEIGNGVLTAAEERAHFGLWAISKSPLLLGTDLTKISASSLATIKNAGVIAINQDSLGKAATTFQPPGQAAPVSGQLYPYWAGQLSDGYVIGLVAVNGAATLSVSFSSVPGLGAGPYSWTELYTGASGSGTSVSATLTTHDMAVFKVSTGGAVVGTTSTFASATKTTTTAVATSTGSGDGGGTGPVDPSQQWAQCGGIGFVGSTTCVAPYTCHYLNDCEFIFLSTLYVSRCEMTDLCIDYSQCY